MKTQDQINESSMDSYREGFRMGKFIESKNTELQNEIYRALVEALAHLDTIANFGGTLDQARQLASKGVDRCREIL